MGRVGKILVHNVVDIENVVSHRLNNKKKSLVYIAVVPFGYLFVTISKQLLTVESVRY